jgi:flagellar basal-body rod protein FlgF
MDRMIYSALSAMRGTMARQQATANNLANASTTGFRAEMAHSEAQYLNPVGNSGPYAGRAHASEGVVAADMQAGVIAQTGNPMDVAMQGEAMLAVADAVGDPAYTRRGDVSVTADGLLQTGDGFLVLGDGGSPLSVPPADSVRIAEDGGVWIVPAGGDATQPQQVGRMQLVNAAGSPLLKGTDNLFRVPGGGALPDDATARLIPGALEASNVNATTALISMIESARAYETNIKMLMTAQSLDEAGAGLMRLD